MGLKVDKSNVAPAPSALARATACPVSRESGSVLPSPRLRANRAVENIRPSRSTSAPPLSRWKAGTGSAARLVGRSTGSSGASSAQWARPTSARRMFLILWPARQRPRASCAWTSRRLILQATRFDISSVCASKLSDLREACGHIPWFRCPEDRLAGRISSPHWKP